MGKFMSEISDQERGLQSARLENSLKENTQLALINRQVSSQLRAARQCVEEYMNANINIRSSMLMLEEDVRNMNVQINQNITRIHALEQENQKLRNELNGNVIMLDTPDVVSAECTQ
jgi:hypothetical protein